MKEEIPCGKRVGNGHQNRKFQGNQRGENGQQYHNLYRGNHIEHSCDR